ncbi:MAG: hypothetical protein GY775_20420 [Candidatus Scalindua sp.]|nr:hypothetical protein [Candidatus Scalindua sp.]
MNNLINLSVAILPGYSIEAPGNPYFPLLYQQLKKQGIDSSKKKITSFSFLWLIKSRKKFNIIHFHWFASLHSSIFFPKHVFRSMVFVLNLIIARLMNYKIVWTVHNIYPHFTEVEKAGHYLFVHHLVRLCMAQLADAVIAHTVYSLEQVKKKFHRRKMIFAIPHGNYISWYPNAINKEEARKGRNIPQDCFVYLLFGCVCAYKNILEIVRQFKKGRMDDDILLIAGMPVDGILQGELERIALLDRQIYLQLKHIEDSEVQLYFNASDIVIIHQDINTVMSGVLMLALSFGKPVIAPEYPNNMEIIDEDCGITYDPVDKDGLSRAIQVARNLDLGKAENAAFEKAKNYDWRKIAKLTANIYRKLLVPTNHF